MKADPDRNKMKFASLVTLSVPLFLSLFIINPFALINLQPELKVPFG